MTVDFGQLHILVVDDQMLVRSLLTQSLKSMGVLPEHIHHAIDGATAKRTLDVKRVDLVLCDLQMEPMNGMDLLKQLRCGLTHNAPNLPFVFLSAHADKPTILLAARFHADGFVVKPPKPAELERHLRTALTIERPEPNPFHYFTIPTGTAHDRHRFGQQMDDAARLLDERGDAGERVPLQEAQPGRVLAQDLKSRHGQLLLMRGAEITLAQLKVLREFEDRFGVHELMLIRPEGDDTPSMTLPE